MRRQSISKTTAATGLFLVAAIALSAGADAKGTRSRVQCKASGTSDISMSARYEVRKGGGKRETFSTEFEAAPGIGFGAGKRLKVKVKGVKVGRMKLEALVGGDIVGDLNFDTRPQADADPFPANWPKKVGRSTKVEILRGKTGILACTLN